MKKYNVTLEQIVGERTRKLNEALKRLQQSFDELAKTKQELENLDRAKENFLQIISHEIRTPLNGVLGFTELLLEKMDSTEYQEYLQLVQESVRRLEHFSIRALLITELKTEKYCADIQNIGLTETIHNVLHKLNHEIGEKKITVKINLRKEKVLADQELLMHTLLNILDNAIRHSPFDSCISIEGSEIKNNTYKMVIRDEGKGFPPEFIPYDDQLFVNNHFVDHNPGLGIYAVNLMMKYMGGGIKLFNQRQGGAGVALEFLAAGSGPYAGHYPNKIIDKMIWQ